MSRIFQQFSETSPLRTVIIGRYEGYAANKDYVEIVNEDQKTGLPDPEDLASEFEQFRRTLTELGVEVFIPEYVGKFVYDQLTPRDIGVTIGRSFVVCNMTNASRRYEAAGIFPHILKFAGKEPNILIPPDRNALLEGGDIIVDKGCIYVGVSQRTNMQGVKFLENQFGDEFEIVPVLCRSLEEGENVLHLDCAFNPVGKNLALIYSNGFRDIPEVIHNSYEWIEINAEEQAMLATNVLSVDKSTVISREHPACNRVNDAMRNRGLYVIEIPFNAAPSTGGSFRCCSLPLFRS